MRRPVIPTAVASALLLAPARAQEPSFDERLIATVPEGIELEGEPRVGPDGKEWPNVMRVVWAPDGSQVAYVGLVDGVSHPVVGEQVGEEYDFASAPVFGATGADVAFRVGRRKSKSSEEWWALVNGEPIGPTAWIGELAFSSDGERMAWWTQPGARIGREGAYERGDHVLVLATRKKGKWKLQRGDEWSDALTFERPRFDAKGRVIAGASKRDLWYVISFDGRREKELCNGQEWLRGFAVAPKGDDVALVAWDFDGWTGTTGSGPGTVVCVDKERYGRGYEAASRPVFSPDGRHIAYEVRRGGIAGVAFDEEEEAEVGFDGVSDPVFSPDGRRIAYVGREGPGANGNGVPVDPSAHPDPTAKPRRRATLVLRDAKEGAAMETGAAFLEIGDLVFAPDGEVVGFRARDAEGWRVMVGDVRSAPFDEVGAPRFSDDGERVGFGARAGRELWWKVLELEVDER